MTSWRRWLKWRKICRAVRKEKPWFVDEHSRINLYREVVHNQGWCPVTGKVASVKLPGASYLTCRHCKEDVYIEITDLVEQRDLIHPLCPFCKRM
jgi:hypothetical protein